MRSRKRNQTSRDPIYLFFFLFKVKKFIKVEEQNQNFFLNIFYLFSQSVLLNA